MQTQGIQEAQAEEIRLVCPIRSEELMVHVKRRRATKMGWKFSVACGFRLSTNPNYNRRGGVEQEKKCGILQ